MWHARSATAAAAIHVVSLLAPLCLAEDVSEAAASCNAVDVSQTPLAGWTTRRQNRSEHTDAVLSVASSLVVLLLLAGVTDACNNEGCALDVTDLPNFDLAQSCLMLAESNNQIVEVSSATNFLSFCSSILL